MRKYALAVALASALLLSGCGGDKETSHQHENGTYEQYETTASIDVMPKLLSVYTDHTQNLYAAVEDVENILKEVKCYCGCMDNSAIHDSLHRCFIAGQDEKGVKWTDHGAQCGTCLAELEDAKRLKDEGKSLQEIKDFIDNKYKGTSPQM